MRANLRYVSLAAALTALAVATSPKQAKANDGIFLAAPSARHAIDFDKEGFIIGGKRTFIASAGIEYARVPRALWRDRLLKIRRAGLNCVEVYTFWNFHEPQEGHFDFQGDHDLDAFLKLAKSLGLYAILRVGPYYCAEWYNGGYPIWLRNKPGVLLREENAEAEKYIDRYFDHLIPIVASNQISRGGNVILVQLENEHPQGWGTEMPNPYFRHLRDKAVSLGLEVPYFFSGLHHSSDPAGDQPWDSVDRSNPWFSTEFWVIWYNRYGESANDVTQFDRNTWKIIAYGGNGYNYYMFHGGSNFGFTNNDEDAASYDYGAAIGQGGDLRPFYYRAKRAATFARSFASILEASHNSTSDYASLVDNADLKVTARTATAGTIMFLDNPTHSKVTADLRSADGASTQSVTLEPQQIRPVVMGYSVAPGIDIAESACVSSVYKQTGVTTIVVSGDTEGAAEIDFHVSPSWKVISGNDGFDRQGSSLVLRAKAGDTPRCYRLASGLHQVRVLLVSDAMADRTWFVDAGPRKLIVCGPSYVGDVKMSTGRVLLRDEEPLGRECRKAIAFGDSDTPMTLNRPRSTGSAAPPYVPTLSQWIAVAETAPAAPGFDDSRWLTTGDDPRQMGADGDTSAYAWYRATATVPQTGRYVVSWSRIGDHATLYVDGKPCSPNDLSLPAGPHTIAVFTDHSGRAKAGNIGRLDIVDPKGITGPVGLVQSTQSPSTITSWLVKVLDPQTKPGDAIPPLDDRNWKTVSKDTDVFNGASTYAWFHTDIPPSGSASAELDFQNVDDNADVYVNGIKVGRHEGWGIPFRINAASAWRKGQPNSIDVLVQNASGPGGIYGDTEVNYFDTWVPVKGWRMKGGVPSEDASGNNLPISAGPAHYRSTFTLPSTYRDGDLDGQHPIYRITFAGLSRGSIWLNGHNLGQYPEKIPIDGLYMPECWLQPGINHVTIFDTSGNSPAQVRVEVEQAASRSVFMLSSP